MRHPLVSPKCDIYFMKLYVRWEVIKILLHGYDLKMSDNKEASVLHATQQPVQKLGLCPLHVQA